MSAKSVESILMRAIEEPGFAKLIEAKPEIALAGYEDLTMDEFTAILEARIVVDFSTQTQLAERKSFAVAPNHNETVLITWK